MKTKILSIVALAALTITSCKTAAKKEQKQEVKTEVKEHAEKKEEHKKHWAYTGETNPEHWKELEGDAACGGNAQSPINIIATDAVKGTSGLKLSDIHYSKETLIHDIVNNGHSIQYNFKGGENYVNYNGKRYDLAQFHFHSPSEHTVNGVRYPLVMHMVHVSKEKDFVVFAILFEEGKENKSFDFLESYLPIHPGEKKAIGKAYDFSKDLPSSFEHYNYKGSLTTPPCTEAVNWFVFTTPETVSEAQVKALAALMPKDNFRPTQAVNGRTITLSK